VTEAQVSCRWATLDDMPALREVFRRSSLSNAADHPLLVEHPEFLELSQEHIAAGRSRVAVSDQGTIVGFATTICTGPVAELEDLFVDPDHQHRSIGTFLLNDAAAVARRHSAYRIELTANPSSMNFYLRNGFVSLGDMVLKYGRAVRMRLEVPELGVSRAAEQAQKAAARAGVTVASVREIDALDEMSGLFEQTWGGHATPMNSHILRAMTLAGNYVAAAMQVGGGLVGASAGFAAIRGEEQEIHSHVTAVRPELRAAGIGRALKLHQRAWALDRAISIVTWTFDPLVRRNAIFNISRLGARPTAYLQNVYGSNMGDEINRDDLSDRFWLRWELESPAVDAAAEGARIELVISDEGKDEGQAGQVRVLLSASPSGAPELEPVLEIEPGVRYTVSVPQDIEAMRRESPAMAAAWRQETRGVFSEILASGGTVSISPDGDYIVERGTEGGT
jgi:predicted GNAT superfamily acetyltransferase/N-acetylglutamate synthase-like GNAT family acetyltransferase